LVVCIIVSVMHAHTNIKLIWPSEWFTAFNCVETCYIFIEVKFCIHFRFCRDQYMEAKEDLYFQRYLYIYIYIYIYIWKVKVQWSRYRPGVAQRVGSSGIALLFPDCGNRRGRMVSSTPRPHFTAGNDQVPILLEARWVPGPVWMGGKSHPHRDSIPDRPVRSQTLYRLSYPPPYI